MIYGFAKGLFKTLLILMRWKVEGRENLPAEGPVIVVANHVSNWDPIVVGCALNRKIRFMAKAELFSLPVVSGLVRSLGAFPVKRGKSDIGAIRQSIKVLHEGEVLGIFPEGTRGSGNDLLKGMPGMVLIMEKTGAPVVLVAVKDTPNLFFSGWRKPPRVVLSRPMDFSDLQVSGEARKTIITSRIMEELSQLAKSI